MEAPAVLPLAGRLAVVTGAGRGIGAAIAQRLAADGASLCLLGRQRAPLDALCARLPASARARAWACDVTEPASVQAVFEALRAEAGEPDMLVNNAGAAESAPLARTTDDLWQRLLAVNLTGVFLCSRAVVPGMSARGSGRIVNIASTAGLKGYAYVSAYAAAKHGVIGLTRSLALELATRGVTVNAVCPGFTDTDLLRDSLANVVATTGRSEAEARSAFVRHNPQGRLVEPAEVADAVAWLCSPGSASITGQSISVSGGETS